MTANSVTFSTLPIWVQVWGLPFHLFNEEAGWEIGKSLGHVYEVDDKTFVSDQARFIRIRVGISLEKPIRRGGWVANPEGDKVRVGFKYERLVGVCYQCGKFGHEVKDCSEQGTSQQVGKPYGDWLKAGFRQKHMGVERTKTNAPPPTPVPEPPQRAMVSINSHDEVASNNDINGIYGRRENGSALKYPYQSQTVDFQENQAVCCEEVIKENSMDARIRQNN
ncbi:uncharacterized protein LOC142639827 [Castanea sativa]|uniref:uncharacterized protein LOC142639827 n=1 Tax=Castanea sativa TaxID=21020 RepID=UPI003F652F99